MLKKLVLGTLVLATVGCGVSFANDYVTRTEFNQVANDVYDLNNDSIIRDWRLEDKIKDTNKRIDDLDLSGYDDTKIVEQISQIKSDNDKLQGQVQNNTEMSNKLQQQINGLSNDFDNFKTETRKGISQALAIAGLEKPVYDSDHKTSIMIGTGTYKCHTSIAYGIAYQPNYDMVFSIKGSEDSVTTSMGFNL